MALIAQPWRHPLSGMYYIRRFIPYELRPIIGKVEIRRSLGTKDYRQAKILFAEAYATTERLIAEARNHGGISRKIIDALPGNARQSPPHALYASDISIDTPTKGQTQTPQMRLSQVFQRYTEHIVLANKPEHVRINHESQLRKVIERFIELSGDLAVNTISPTHIQNFAAALATVPVISGRTVKSGDIEQLKKLAQPDTPKLSTATIRVSIARLSSLLSFAVESGDAASNPVTVSRILRKLDASKPKRCLDDDKGYRWEELVLMFSQPDFQNLRYSSGRPGNAVFWIPLIAAYTGARREEIAQLYVSDLRQHQSNQWFIRITDDRPDKSVKTDSSRRDLPIHDDLIAIGLLELVQGQDLNSRIFPQLTKVSGRYSGIAAKQWLQLVRSWGVYRPGRHPLHGFRHTFKTLAREHGIPKEISDWITGHSSGNVGDSYGINPMSRMADEMRKFPSIAKATGLLPPT